MDEARPSDSLDEWLREHSSADVKVVMADFPAPGTDWQAQDGWGWIFKAWFASRSESREAAEAIRAEGWVLLGRPKSWSRKLRVHPADGYDGQMLVDFVLARWPRTRVQLRND